MSDANDPLQTYAATTATGRRDRIADGLEACSRGLVVAAVFLVPVIFDRRAIDAFNLVKLTVLWTATVLAWTAYLAATELRGTRRHLFASRIVGVAIILAGVTTLAALLSANPPLSFLGLYQRYEGVLSLVLYVAVLVLIGVLYRDRPEQVRDLLAAIGLAAAVVALYVTAQRVGTGVTGWIEPAGGVSRYPIGNLGNSNFTASFLGIAMPAVTYLALSAKSIAARCWWIVGGIVVVIALWFTQGRGGMLAGLTGVAALALFLSSAYVRWKVAAIFAALVVLSALPFVAAMRANNDSKPAVEVLRTESVRYRTQTWTAAWNMFRDRPVLGWGPESFYGNYVSFRTAANARERGLEIPDKPHNIFLAWAVATGTAGLVVYLILLYTALTAAARRLTDATYRHRRLVAAMVALLVAYLAQGLFSVDVPPLALMGWVALGGLAALVGPHVGTHRKNRATRWPVRVLAGAVGLALLVLGFRPLRADHAAWAAESHARIGWSRPAMEAYQRAVRLFPPQSAYLGLVAAYFDRIAADPSSPYTRKDALLRAVEHYERAHHLQPKNLYFMINIAKAYARLGNEVDTMYFADGARWLDRALVEDAFDPAVHDLFADYLDQWAQETNDKAIHRRALGEAIIAKRLRDPIASEARPRRGKQPHPRATP